MSKVFLISLYFTSFIPLWVSILVVDIISMCTNKENVITEIISIIIISILLIFSLIVLLIEIKCNDKNKLFPVQLLSVNEEKSISPEYLLSYILPLFAFDFTQWTQVALFLIFFITLAFLCIKHNYFSINVILEIFKFSFYECKLKNIDGVEIRTYIISNRNLKTLIGDKVYLKRFNNEYALDITKNE